MSETMAEPRQCCQNAMLNCQPHCQRCGNETWLLADIQRRRQSEPELLGDILRRMGQLEQRQSDIEQLVLAGIQPGAEYSLTGRLRDIVKGLRKAHGSKEDGDE